MFLKAAKGIHRYYRKISRPVRHWWEEWRWPDLLKLDFYLSWMRWPLERIMDSWRLRRGRNFWMGLPAIIVGVVAIVMVALVNVRKSETTRDYWNGATTAIANQNHPLALMLLQRVMEDSPARQNDARFELAKIYDERSETARAEALYQLLAPFPGNGGGDGHPEAHRRLAMIIAETISGESPQFDKDRLKYHLTAARNTNDSEIQMAWGRFYVSTGDREKAVTHLKRAADDFKQLYAIIAELQFSLKNAEHRAYFLKAENYLYKELAKTPEDQKIRIDYARVLSYLGKYDEAEKVLQEGAERHSENKTLYNRYLSNLTMTVLEFRLADTDNPPQISEMLTRIRVALEYNPNNGLALNRLMSYANANVEGENGSLRDVLESVIADGKEPALAHLAMGNLYWLENEKELAVRHFNRALRIRDDMAVVMNNLAWLMAHSEENPRFELAMELVEKAIALRPNSPNFKDTRGTIYFLQEDWENALTDLEEALESIPNKRPLWGKLATIYEKTGEPGLAVKFRSRADAPETGGQSQ